MFLLTVLLSLLLSSYAYAGTTGQDLWYIRSANACQNHGDGTSYDCAQVPGGKGAYTTTAPGALNWAPVTGIDDGDVVYICGVHTTPFFVPDTAAGSVTKPIVINFSCPGDPGKLKQLTTHHSSQIQSTWVEESPSLWYLQLQTPNSPKRVWKDGLEIIRSESKALLGTVIPDGPVRAWWHDAVTNRLYLKSPVNPTLTFQTLESLAAWNTSCAFAAMCFQKQTNQYFDIIDPVLEGGNLGSLYIAGASYINVKGTVEGRCRIGGRSNRGAYIGDTAANGTGWPAHHVTINNCTIDGKLGTQFDGYMHEWNGTTHDGLFVADSAHSNTFTNLVLRNWQHTGIAFIAIRTSGTVINNVVDNVTFICDDFIEYCRAFAIDGLSAGKASGNRITNSVIDGMTVRSQYNGDHNVLDHNLFVNQRIGKVTLGKYNLSQVIEIQSYVGPSDANSITNNVFYNTSTAPCISFRPDAYAETNYLIEGNIFVGCGGPDMPEAQNAAIYWPQHALVTGHVIRNNVFFNTGVTLPILYNGAMLSFSELNNACPTCSGNIDFVLMSFEIRRSAGQSCGLGMQWGNTLQTYNFCVVPK